MVQIEYMPEREPAASWFPMNLLEGKRGSIVHIPSEEVLASLNLNIHNNISNSQSDHEQTVIANDQTVNQALEFDKRTSSTSAINSQQVDESNEETGELKQEQTHGNNRYDI